MTFQNQQNLLQLMQLLSLTSLINQPNNRKNIYSFSFRHNFPPKDNDDQIFIHTYYTHNNVLPWVVQKCNNLNKIQLFEHVSLLLLDKTLTISIQLNYLDNQHELVFFYIIFARSGCRLWELFQDLRLLMQSYIIQLANEKMQQSQLNTSNHGKLKIYKLRSLQYLLQTLSLYIFQVQILKIHTQFYFRNWEYLLINKQILVVAYLVFLIVLMSFYLFYNLIIIFVTIIYLQSNLTINLQFIKMEQEIAKLRQQKQNYITDRIDPNLYQDFFQFCGGQQKVDINSWSLEYVQQIVADFIEDQKKKLEQQNQHERSFAVYQTTSGENQITGSASLEMNEILQTLQQQPKPVNLTQSPPPTLPIQPTNVIISQNQPSPKPFSKKQASPSIQNISTPPNIKQSQKKQKSNKISAVQLLDSAFEQIKDLDKSKIQEKGQKLNKSFFDTSNFWEVPKLDNFPKNTKVQSQVPKVQSPQTNKEFKSIKLNLNVNQLTQNAQKNNVVDKKKQQSKIYGQEIQAISYAGNQGNIQTFFNTGKIAKPKQQDLKSQFDTFSQIAEQQVKKKRNNTVAVSNTQHKPNNVNNNAQKSVSSTIKLKQIKQFKPSPSTLSKSSKASSFKQPYKGARIFKQDFIDQVFCVKSTIRQNLAHQDLAVQIKGYDIIHRSIFSSNYLMYNMKVLPKGNICKRNYEDFQKLQLTLAKFYPGIQMPYLEKQGWRPDTSEDFAKKQIQMLQHFMGDILRNPELRNSRITEQFLSIPDHKKMKRQFEQYDRMAKLKSIQDLCLLDGKVEVTLTQKQRIYNEMMSKLVIKTENNIEKYRKSCQSLSQYYSQAMTTILSIDDIIKQMQKDLQQFNKCVTTKQIQNLDDSLKMIRNNYTQNYFRMKFQKGIIQESVIPFLKYQKQNFHVSKDIIDTSNSLITRYLKRMQSEANQSMDSSYLSSNYKQFKQGILEQSKNILVLKYQAGYLQSQASSELHRIYTNFGIKIDTLWKNIGVKYLEQFSRSVNLWSQNI